MRPSVVVINSTRLSCTLPVLLSHVGPYTNILLLICKFILLVFFAVVERIQLPKLSDGFGGSRTVTMMITSDGDFDRLLKSDNWTKTWPAICWPDAAVTKVTCRHLTWMMLVVHCDCHARHILFAVCRLASFNPQGAVRADDFELSILLVVGWLPCCIGAAYLIMERLAASLRVPHDSDSCTYIRVTSGHLRLVERPALWSMVQMPQSTCLRNFAFCQAPSKWMLRCARPMARTWGTIDRFRYYEISLWTLSHRLPTERAVTPPRSCCIWYHVVCCAGGW